MAQISRRMLSAKAEQFTESVIREMTRLAMKHHAVNLSQGFPDFAAPEEIKEAYRQRMREYHPDKVAHLGPDFRSLAERKAKEINEAYEALSHRWSGA